MIIGNFFDDSNTDTSSCAYSLAYAYYFIDMICVSDDSSACSLTSISELDAPLVSIYPNPFLDLLNIDFGSLNLPYHIRVYNSLGQIIFTKLHNTIAHHELVTYNFPKGLVFLELNYNNCFYYYKLLKI